MRACVSVSVRVRACMGECVYVCVFINLNNFLFDVQTEIEGRINRIKSLRVKVRGMDLG